MAWPTTTAGDTLSGKDALVLGQDLYDRAMCAKGGGATWYFAEASSAVEAYTDVATCYVRCPETLRTADLVQITVVAHDNCAAVCYYMARETGGPVTGTEQETAAADAISTSEIVVPDNTWAGAVKTFAVQVKRGAAAGTVYAKGDTLFGNVRFKTS